nr:ubiquitin hydrolase [Tanacetum cinerariifolium]
IAEYKAREVKYIETIRSLEKDKECNLGKINKLINDVETLQNEKDLADGKLARLLKSSKYLEDIIESQRSKKVKEGLGYNAVPPPAADLYLSSKKDLSWTGLPEFMDYTMTDYSRPSPTVSSTSAEDQNNDTSTSEETASINLSKPFIKFIKPKDSQLESKIKEQKTPKKPQVKNSKQNRESNGRPKGNQRNWNNLKSYQLGPEFVLHTKPCFNCGNFSDLAKDCRRRVQRETN